MAVRIDIGNEIWAECLQRSSAKGACRPEEQGAAARIAKKISRGATIATSLKLPSLASMSVFYDHFHSPTLLLDRVGSVVYLNRATEALMGNGLSCAEARIAFAMFENDSGAVHVGEIGGITHNTVKSYMKLSLNRRKFAARHGLSS